MLTQQEIPHSFLPLEAQFSAWPEGIQQFVLSLSQSFSSINKDMKIRDELTDVKNVILSN